MLLKAEKISIPSVSPPDVVQARLRARAMEWRESALSPSEIRAGVIGWSFKERPDRVTLRAQVSVRNGCVPHFVGTVRASNSGSQLEGELRLTWFARLFILIWLGAVGSGPLLALIGPMPNASVGERWFVAIFMLLPCGALFAGGWWVIARSSRQPTIAIKELLADAAHGASQRAPAGRPSPGI